MKLFLYLIDEAPISEKISSGSALINNDLQVVDEIIMQLIESDQPFEASLAIDAIINNNLDHIMDQIDWEGDNQLKAQYESEARFIRAYMYFDLMRLFGHVPLLTEPSTENIPQAAPEEVYKVIAEDLSFASENLEAAPYTSVESGRVTKWAAKSMLARVYLYYTGYYVNST